MNKYICSILLIIISQSIYSSTIYKTIKNNLLPDKTFRPQQMQPYTTKRFANDFPTTTDLQKITPHKPIPSKEDIKKRYPNFNPEKEEFDTYSNSLRSKPIRIQQRYENE